MRNAVWIFWIALVVGTLALIFGLLLAQVPRPVHNANFALDYVFRSSTVGLMLISLISGRYEWKRWCPPDDVGWATEVICYAGLVIVVSLCATVSLALEG